MEDCELEALLNALESDRVERKASFVTLTTPLWHRSNWHAMLLCIVPMNEGTNAPDTHLLVLRPLRDSAAVV